MVYAIIPARGGSKGVPKKNIKPLAGYPLIAYSIIAAKLAKYIKRIIVSTDSPEIAQIASLYGAEVPFLRPAEIAQDHSTDLQFMLHAIAWFNQNEKQLPDLWVHLRPTTPLREPKLIDQAIERIIAQPRATGLRSVHQIPESPHKMFFIKKDYLVGLFPADPRPEYYNLPRQEFEPVYQPNGYVDIIKTKTITQDNLLHGFKMLSYITENVGELDKPEDFDFIEYKIKEKPYTIVNYLKKQYKPV